MIFCFTFVWVQGTFYEMIRGITAYLADFIAILQPYLVKNQVVERERPNFTLMKNGNSAAFFKFKPKIQDLGRVIQDMVSYEIKPDKQHRVYINGFKGSYFDRLCSPIVNSPSLCPPSTFEG